MLNRDDKAMEVAAVIFANAIRRRFDALAGEPLLFSPIVFQAALEVARVIFGPQDDPFKALDEIEYLERLAREAAS